MATPDSCSVELTVTNECGSASYIFIVGAAPNSVDELGQLTLGLQLYPNPSYGILNVKNETIQKVKRIAIYDVLRKEMKTIYEQSSSIEQFYS